MAKAEEELKSLWLKVRKKVEKEVGLSSTFEVKIMASGPISYYCKNDGNSHQTVLETKSCRW